MPFALGAQRSDEIIARDLAAIDVWNAKLDSLPGAANDPWRAAAARAWLDAAQVARVFPGAPAKDLSLI